MDPVWPDIEHAYDTVARDYATAFADELAGKPFDRSLLNRYAAAVAGRGPVWDVGCGPAGHVTRYLADLGVATSGVDLSRRVVDLARAHQPDLAFRLADMRALGVEDAALAGLVAFYSLIHLPRPELPAALAEFHRVLAPGGALLLAMHGGDGEAATSEWFGHAVDVRATLVSASELAELVRGAGFSITEQHAREPYDFEYPSTRLYVWAVRP